MQFLEDMSDDDKINPNEWTQKELVKHLWRETTEQRKEIKGIAEAVKKLEEAEMKRETILQEHNAKSKQRLAWVGVAAALIGAVMDALIKFLKTFQ